MPIHPDPTRTGVLVGVDGSETSLLAVDWAAGAAAGMERPLTICLVSEDDHAFGPSATAELHRRGGYVLSSARSRALEAQPALQVVTRLVSGQPAGELIRLAAQADLLVVGSHGTGWLHRFLIGTTSTQVAAHAPGPVVVTRTGAREDSGPIVVGVDGSEPSRSALDFGFDTAARQGMALSVIHAYTVPPVLTSAGTARGSLPTIARRAAAALLQDVVAPWAAKYPEVALRSEVRRGPASQVLVEASMTASMLVVGSRGRGGFAGLVLGSVSQHVLALAGCPVVIAH